MTIHIDTCTSIILISILGIMFILFGITTFVLISKIKQANRQLEDTNRLLYFNMKDSLLTRSQTSKCLEEIEIIQNDVHELSSGLQLKLQRNEEKAKQKKYPKPDEVAQITETIRDIMSIEMIKRSQQKSPIGGALVDIAYIVCQTYPNISDDYISDKCIAIMQELVG